MNIVVGIEYTGFSLFIRFGINLKDFFLKPLLLKVCLESFLTSILTSAYIERLIEQRA